MQFPLVPVTGGPPDRPSFNCAPLADRMEFLGMLWYAVCATPEERINLDSRQQCRRDYSMNTRALFLNIPEVLGALRLGYVDFAHSMYDTHHMRSVPDRFVFAEGGLSNFLFAKSNRATFFHFGGSMKAELLARIMVVAWALEEYHNYTESVCKNEWSAAAIFNNLMRTQKFDRFARPYIEAAMDA